MLRALIFAGIAAAAGRQLYKNGSLQRFGDKVRDRADDLKAYASEKRASIEAAGGPGGAPIRPTAVHDHKPTPA
ncbi:hypothetical protein LWE61_01905 [Sphingobium sufflavum]|uniref:hypothetical protein n=1 Tax=Sphingobium sufflavum TaxID=1129547 RepID=UPI001F389E10|nr:hypothetical protein [Sphingobium sufflavum]MCE7795306.1 hypothetical protein [Sphingobium sufflavum]